MHPVPTVSLDHPTIPFNSFALVFLQIIYENIYWHIPTIANKLDTDTCTIFQDAAADCPDCPDSDPLSPSGTSVTREQSSQEQLPTHVTLHSMGKVILYPPVMV